MTYDDGVSEDEKAEITGVTITVDGTTYESGSVTIYSDSTVTMTVTGRNLLNGAGNICIEHAAGYSYLIDKYDNISEDGTTATLTFNASIFDASTNYEIVYYNDYDTNKTPVGTGIIVAYNSGTKPTEPVTTATITGVTLSGVETNDAGAYVINPNSTVTITVSGTDFDKLDENNQVELNGTAEALTTANGWTIDTTNNTATKQYVGTTFADGLTLKYTNDGGTNWTTVVITISYETPADTISVVIKFGDMSFTYDDTTDEWASDTNGVTVINNSSVGMIATVTYTPASGYTDITGSFNEESYGLPTNQSITFTLTLNGTPTEALNNATIGSVTVTITEDANTPVVPDTPEENEEEPSPFT